MASRKKLGMMSMMAGAALLLSGATLRADALEGVVTDAMCGISHSGKPADKCTAGCVGKGSALALVVGDKVYTLKGKVAGLEKMGGAKAKINGKVDGTNVEVESFAPGM